MRVIAGGLAPNLGKIEMALEIARSAVFKFIGRVVRLDSSSPADRHWSRAQIELEHRAETERGFASETVSATDAKTSVG